ncbi:metal ABC transporter substrate-binding protein [Thermaerobacillus caldiproteolyticus]|uniref:Zinc transport system substrate-binding protein n=1 Tax=Thermaerobacillus caldiproteolyticus TaxID=247480 RepID=A0A7W0BWV6_9BACL|nr:metal ABC transporter substrate-binding protein [Anoxybacillus caldiproteolyticus]MBA2873906.1 zinc transport system substrate-binding protein [Anoxybacillus caldiproteolyticus]QPA30452.1 zinc ABC transporter substrate-binding protein [Anoxybacillus caldiproteolyticus]
MKTKAFILSLLLVVSAFLYGCNAENNQEQTTEKAKDVLTIYTTVYPLKDFAEKIGGKYVKAQSVYPPGVEAHTFEPTTKTMKDLADADAFIYIGQGMEGFVDQTTKTLKNEDVKLVEAAKGIKFLDSTHEHDVEAEDEHNDEHHHGDKDPHVWLDPVLCITIAENIKNALVELKPEAKDTFEKNFASLKQQLEDLDQQFQAVVKESPKKEILVSHAAYGYWEKRYGIEQLSVAGLSPTNEPSQKELANIIKTAKQHDIKYILFEQNVTPKVAEVVKNEIGAEALHLHNLEALTNEDIKKNKDYITIMKENLEVLKKALH